MQICSLCHTSSPDASANCVNCQADLSIHSEISTALIRIQKNDRIQAVRLSVAHDCCPACRNLEGSYSKDNVPRLPVTGCSNPNGCRCTYLPVLDVLFP